MRASALLRSHRAAAWARAALTRLVGTAPVRAVLGLVGALRREREARRAAAQLREWDDRMLHDIGIRRMDIEAAVRGRLDAWRRRRAVRGRPFK